MKKFIKILLIVLLVIVLAAIGLVAWLTITEFKPEAIEEISVSVAGECRAIAPEQELSLVSWNIGYAGLGKESDFFMDGGQEVQAADRDTVERYLSGIQAELKKLDADIALLQEVDVDSTRSYRLDQTQALAMSSSAHALNYSCDFVPFPLPPIGRVNSGVFTTADALEIAEAERISLPCPFSWPVSAANLKRCLLVSYFPIQDSDKQLVAVNLHLEAYDDGEGKLAQTRQLMDFIQSEYEKGNYVIAGGDFNQVFPGSLEVYPNRLPELWTPGVLDEASLPEGWQYVCDLDVPSCRLLNQPYDPSDAENTQHYIIDGFILSPNVDLKDVQGIDLGFENSDHNPVKIVVELN